MPEKEESCPPKNSEQILEIVTEFAGIRLTSRIEIATHPTSVTIRLDDPLIEIDSDGIEE